MYQLTVTTPPSETAVSLDEAKAQLRVDGDEEDALITGLIESATVVAELSYTWRAFVTRSYELTMLASAKRPLSGNVYLPMPPVTVVAAVTVDGVTTVDYELLGDLGLLILGSGVSASSRLVVAYTAGYGDAAAVPANIKRAMLLMIGHWYENREGVVVGAGIAAAKVPMSVESLLMPFRAWRPG